MSDSYIKRLIETFDARADKVAMRIVGDDTEVYTFGESLSAIRSVAYRLGQENVGKGDRVALIGENHPCWAIAYLGTLYHGAVCVPLDPHGEIETITNFLENSEAKVAFIGPDFVQQFKQIEEKLKRRIPAVVWNVSEPPALAGGLTRPQNNIKLTNGHLQPPATAGGSDSFADWSSTEFPESFAAEIPDINDDDNALLIYTSGTTGTPKGVPLTHGNIIAELIGVDDVLRFRDDEKMTCTAG